MKQFAAIFLVTFVSASAMAETPVQCSIPGDALHWQADYCLYVVGTDDIIAAGPCLERESKILFRSRCNEKFHYKRAICELIIKSGGRSGTIDNCVQDPTFVGPTVRNGGA